MEATAAQTKTRDFNEVKQKISEWLKNYLINSKQQGYVIGVSGGIDSAVCSTLCALTGFPVLVVKMSIHQAADQADRGDKHINWLKKNFPNVYSMNIDLTSVYDEQLRVLQHGGAFTNVDTDSVFLTSANTRARLRMVTLYGLAGAHKSLVCGTGNKVEDYGIGFFTKFGDGGVDVSPIGELTKTEVYALGKELGVIEEILGARPTDGLWEDGRTDEDQIGATYPELEWAMKETETRITLGDIQSRTFVSYGYSDRELIVLHLYLNRHEANMHKMSMPPICKLDS